MDNRILTFFKSPAYAVVGASSDPNKFGNKVLRTYLNHHKKVYPVNPHEQKIEGLDVIHDIKDLPAEVQSISIVTPPKITEQVVEQAINKGIRNIWMQPGAESKSAIQNCIDHQVNVIGDGTCIIKELA